MDPNNSNISDGHLHVQGDDAPPPPYSETDIYSNSGAGHHSRSPSNAVPLHIDDGASSTGDVIYTPPLTPRTSTISPQQTGAALYFESRPAPPPVAPQNHAALAPVIHPVSVNDDSLPDDFPYQNEWAARDVTPQDWATFVNYLLPDHTTRGNEAALHRKLQTESDSESASAGGGVSQVEAQLGQGDVEATIQQWNDGFFGPRHITVRLETPRNQMPQMPGTFSPNLDDPSVGAASGERQTQGQPQSTRWPGFGGLRIDQDSIRYGNDFVADSNGLRIGNLIMDHNGIRMHRNGPGEQQSGTTGPAPNAGQPRPPVGTPFGYASNHDDGVELRGRRIHHYEGGVDKEKHERSPSVSSVSSSSSSSSDSSIGSLPDYDHMPQNTLPLYITRLQNWTQHPDEIRTRSDVKQLKTELKAIAKSDDVSNPSLDKKALKTQIKALQSQWKQIKRQQKRERREKKRERRDRRRAERKEKKQHRKELRKARKEARHGHPPPPQPHPIPAIPPLPPMPSNAPPPLNSFMPPIPPRGCHSSCRGGGFFGSSAGMFGHRHPPGCNGNHSGDHGPFGPNGPFGEHGPFGPSGPFGSGGVFSNRAGWNGQGASRSVPGSWPDDKKEAASKGFSDEAPSPGPIAAAKYRAMADIEAAIDQQAAAASRLGPGPHRDALENVVRELTGNLDQMRLEADEAYARDLAKDGGQ
ncbi:hypothetical protein PT974_05667 [Cladobotryum mycophilum]|uniref:RING finger domain-containing protein n=1 Tax=Cladobotryum mycophilum TaxID=491253 RepID=A0ABR0SKE9_9HYPO